MSHPAKRTKRQQEAALKRNGFDFHEAYQALNRGEVHYVRTFLGALHIDPSPLQRNIDRILSANDLRKTG